MGTVAQYQATAATAFLLGNQVLNYLTTGHSTFQNDPGHKLDAYVPVGKHGVYIKTLSLAGEYSGHIYDLVRRAEQKGGTVEDALTEFARGKVRPWVNSLITLSTRKDYAGRPLTPAQARTSAATGMIPMPIPAGAFIRRDARSPYGMTLSADPDQIARQLIGSALGLRSEIAYPQGQGPLAPSGPQAGAVAPQSAVGRLAPSRVGGGAVNRRGGAGGRAASGSIGGGAVRGGRR
jgi:hypothetical protein